MKEHRVRVLETGEINFEGKRCLIPVKVEIKGRVYETEMEDEYLPISEIHELDIEELGDLTFGEIPEFLRLHFEGSSIGWFKVERGYAWLEIDERAKYYRGNVSIDNYFKLLRLFAIKSKFEVINFSGADGEDDYYFIEFGKEFPENITLKEAFQEFENVVKKVSDIVEILDSLIEKTIVMLEHTS